MDIRTYLAEQSLLFDGSMGTYCTGTIKESRGVAPELLNLSHPEQILKVHQAYIDAGSRAIKTNTFAVNRMNFSEEQCREIIQNAWEIAGKAAKGQAFIFADIGPISVTDAEDLEEEYRFLADRFLELGAECFLFETNSTAAGILETASYIKEKKPEAFLLVSYAPQPDGFTRAGQYIKTLLKDTAASEVVDAVGMNCVSSARHMTELAAKIGQIEKPLAVMPNGGYPMVLGNRTYYDGDPAYFGQQVAELAHLGVKILGGCCGTTPEHIRAAALAIQKSAQGLAPGVTVKEEQSPVTDHEPERNLFWESLCDSKKYPIAVELDPPETADVSKFMKGAKELKEAGASIITIADCPIARARMDSSLLACKLRRELQVDPLPHMTCRDRNLNALKALLLGLCAEGVHNVLTITGDPIPTAERDEVKSVYNFNSRMLAAYIEALSEQSLTTPFRVYGALNVNARNFSSQLQMAKQKIEKGICGFFTQPILTEEAFENLKLARKSLDAKILGGIFPLVSYRNACFMNSEVAGIKVDEKVIAMYEGADREQGEELAVQISTEIAGRIRPYVDGYYLMTPFGRTGLIARLIEQINML